MVYDSVLYFKQAESYRLQLKSYIVCLAHIIALLTLSHTLSYCCYTF